MSDEIEQPSAAELVTIYAMVRCAVNEWPSAWMQEDKDIARRFMAWCDQEISKVEDG